MPSVTIDAGVLAVPSTKATAAQVTEYVETLLDWQRLLNERWIPIHMSMRAAEALVEDGLYPLYDHLQQLFATHGVVEYTANDIVQITNSLLQLTPTFEDVFELTDVLAEKFTTDPNLLLSAEVPPGLAADLERCLILTAVLENCCETFDTEHFLIVRPRSGVSKVQVEAVVQYLEHSRDDVGGVPTPPEYFRAQLAISQNFRELLSSINEEAVWEAAKTDDDKKKAVQLAVYKARINARLESEWEDLPEFTFNKMFLEIAEKYFKARPSNYVHQALEAMADALNDSPVGEPHELRIGGQPENPPRTRNRDIAWRRRVLGGERLHYWKCEDGTIEFGSIGPHENYDIPY